MGKIVKHKEKLTSKERVQRAFRFQEPDRVPINYFAEPAAHKLLAKALGVNPSKPDAVNEALGVDFRGVYPAYTGPMLYEEKEGMTVDPVYGHYTRWLENGQSGYEDFCHFPLQGAEPEAIANYPLPSPDNFDYEQPLAKIKQNLDYALYIGSPGYGDIINSTGRMMGMEDALVNLMTEDSATLQYVDRRIEMQLSVLMRVLEKSHMHMDFIWIGEDLGTQIAPMISLDMYRNVLRPRHQRFVDLAKSYNLPVMIHTCGCSSWVYEDFIEMGINAVDTLQPEAVNMTPEYLKKYYAGRLAFHGCISTAGALAYGTVGDVADAVKSTLEIMMPAKGYMLAPSHLIQGNTPVENILAMYNTAHDFGRYVR